MMPSVSPFFKFSNSYSNSERILVLDCTKGNFFYHIGFYEDGTNYKLQRTIKFTDPKVADFEQSIAINYTKLVKECQALNIDISEYTNSDKRCELFAIFTDTSIRNRLRGLATSPVSAIRLFDEHEAYTLKVDSLVA